MGRDKTLYENEKGRNEAFRKANYSRSRIAKELKRSINVISNYLNAPENYGIKKSPGRKKKLSAKQETVEECINGNIFYQPAKNRVKFNFVRIQ